MLVKISGRWLCPGKFCAWHTPWSAALGIAYPEAIVAYRGKSLIMKAEQGCRRGEIYGDILWNLTKMAVSLHKISAFHARIMDYK